MPTVNLGLQSLDQSKLWEKLDEELRPKVRKTAGQAAALLETVMRHMPLYTFHNERHILNVIGWMEWLLEDVLDSLTPLECALCLLAAYTHDLGMALSEDEYAELLKGESTEFQRFRDRFPEHNRHIERLRKEGHDYGARVIEDHLVTDFLRTTHADERAARLRAHLDGMAPDAFTYKGIDFRQDLELIAISHNQPVAWLRDKLGDGIKTTVDQTPVNFAFPGLVLRLADIMDFDASRTPGILFHHLGLENKVNLLDAKAKEISEREWRKHMAITGVLPENGKLVYYARHCPDPVTEKCIRQFVGWIQEEVDGVRGELPRIGARPGLEKLRLPEVEHNITPKPGAYVYHDWSFQLDHEEIVNLLMGEALYGDPSLCIRELLQNALDAVELRDLRLQYKQKTKGVATTPGKFRDELGAEHEFAVNLTWGQDEAKGWWIQVSDNGVGMTEDTVKRYFTRLGKSSYRSPEFKAEQEAMRREGPLCTPISTFGIGVLSCFMIADRIDVRTNAGGEEKTLDFHVSGPGSLFWAKAGSRKEQGTEVRIWLKEGRALGHDWDRCLAALRRHFGYANEGPDETACLDPCEVAARHVVWPKYPVHIDIPGGQRRTIDHLFHVQVLAPLDVDRLIAKAREWEIPLREEHSPAWGVQDWTDPDTGSRIRLWFPQCGLSNGTSVNLSDAATPIPFWKLATLTEPQMELHLTSRHTLIVQSISTHLDVSFEKVGAMPGPGCRMWVDCRGDAAPRLKADRSEPVFNNYQSWMSAMESLWKRFFTDRQGRQHWRWWQGYRGIVKFRQMLPFGSWNISKLPIQEDGGQEFRLEGEVAFWSAAFALDGDLGDSFIRDTPYDRTPDHALARGFELTRSQSLVDGRDLDDSPRRGFKIELPPDLDLEFAQSWHDSRHNGMAVPASHFLQEGFWPSLRESWPPLGLCGREGFIGEAHLTAPASCEFRNLHPNRLDELKYDLCFPLTAVPLAKLRVDLPAWITERRLRPLAVLPLLFPGNAEIWHKNATNLHKKIGLDSLYAFLPAHDLWWKPFTEWTGEDERHPGNLSLFWNIKTGEVLAYPGLIRRSEMHQRTEGVQPFDQYAEEYVRSKGGGRVTNRTVAP